MAQAIKHSFSGRPRKQSIGYKTGNMAGIYVCRFKTKEKEKGER